MEEFGRLATVLGLLQRNDDNDRQNVNANRRPSNRHGMTPCWGNDYPMRTYKRLFERICSYENLFLAYQKASMGKSKKPYVEEFEKDLQNNLFRLQWELLTHTYEPLPLTVFTVRDPKTRRISASNFRDRVIHHALINVISPIFESRFILDSYANRKGKGTLAAIERFDYFMRKVSGNGRPVASGGGVLFQKANQIVGYALKADIKSYFESVNQAVLLSILRKRINDEETMWLVQLILSNHKTPIPGKGMPLGNLTSQFFANVYLHELDIFVKHELKVKYYLRYVDDFIILSGNKQELEFCLKEIGCFLDERLHVSLHTQKTRIIPLHMGVPLLGFRMFYHYRLLKKSNARRIRMRLEAFRAMMAKGEMGKIEVLSSFAGWDGYARMADTFRLRQTLRKEVEGMLRVCWC